LDEKRSEKPWYKILVFLSAIYIFFFRTQQIFASISMHPLKVVISRPQKFIRKDFFYSATGVGGHQTIRPFTLNKSGFRTALFLAGVGLQTGAQVVHFPA
jgi:hypothetical protein